MGIIFGHTNDAIPGLREQSTEVADEELEAAANGAIALASMRCPPGTCVSFYSGDLPRAVGHFDRKREERVRSQSQ